MGLIQFIRNFMILIISLLILINILAISCSFLVANELVKLMPVNVNSLMGIALITVFTSIFIFVITSIAYLLCKNKKKLKVILDINYLFNLYIWGLLSLFEVFKPEMIKDSILSLNEIKFISKFTSAGAAWLFFVNLTNYYFCSIVIFEHKVIDKLKKCWAFSEESDSIT
ncbi:hypothetical protein [Marinisporobacter balticus]|uniref:Uncharacterized protein n=1 Tax=Marinisporobacter balticus TaxID=2018667 RepID=A0A4R2KYW2_9FIRM|nr:hypothetical protein [Marinisporobacter balticus]TCO79093.1 hypothetical protein EV214_103145 [Marinisporobacter balticus]